MVPNGLNRNSGERAWGESLNPSSTHTINLFCSKGPCATIYQRNAHGNAFTDIQHHICPRNNFNNYSSASNNCSSATGHSYIHNMEPGLIPVGGGLFPFLLLLLILKSFLLPFLLHLSTCLPLAFVSFPCLLANPTTVNAHSCLYCWQPFPQLHEQCKHLGAWVVDC